MLGSVRAAQERSLPTEAVPPLEPLAQVGEHLCDFVRTDGIDVGQRQVVMDADQAAELAERIIALARTDRVVAAHDFFDNAGIKQPDSENRRVFRDLFVDS